MIISLLKSKDVSTGISADDRSKTILALVNPKTKSKQLSRPGHIFPLIAKEGENYQPYLRDKQTLARKLAIPGLPLLLIEFNAAL